MIPELLEPPAPPPLLPALLPPEPATGVPVPPAPPLPPPATLVEPALVGAPPLPPPEAPELVPPLLVGGVPPLPAGPSALEEPQAVMRKANQGASRRLDAADTRS